MELQRYFLRFTLRVTLSFRPAYPLALLASEGMGFWSESFLPQLPDATSTCSFPLQGRHGGAGASPQHVYTTQYCT